MSARVPTLTELQGRTSFTLARRSHLLLYFVLLLQRYRYGYKKATYSRIVAAQALVELIL